MREYINEYVRSQSLEKTGYEILRDHFGVPFNTSGTIEFEINGIPMAESDVKDYIKDFFENLDTTSIIELYNKLKV